MANVHVSKKPVILPQESLISYISPHLLNKTSLPVFFAYLRAPYDTPIVLAAFLKEPNVVGSMSSEEITDVLLSYIGLKPNQLLTLSIYSLPSFNLYLL